MRFLTSLTPQPTASRAYAFWNRVLTSYKQNPFWYWGTLLTVTALAAVLRFINLDHPGKLTFDETYYVKDSYTLARNGYESMWPEKKIEDNDARFNNGDTDFFTKEPSFLAHPPIGKYVIAIGIQLFGIRSPFGWRFTVAIIGTLVVLLTMIIAAKLFRSTLVGGLSGFLLAIDTNAIAMSRIALLDGVLIIFALMALWMVLLDRQWYRRTLSKWVSGRSKHLSQDTQGNYLVSGPLIWWRPWLMLSAVFIGLAASTKWSGIFYYFGLVPSILIIDWVTRKQLGIKYRFQGTFYQTIVSTTISVFVSVTVYALSWIQYYTAGGWGRHWAELPGNSWGGLLSWVPKPFQSWIYFQSKMLEFNSNLTKEHPYQSAPYQWPLLQRPTNMYWVQDRQTDGEPILQVILGLPNPLLWWTAWIVFAVLALMSIFMPTKRDWRINFLLMSLASGYLPWMMYIHRTVFHFYTVIFQPFMMMLIAAAIYLILKATYKEQLIPKPVMPITHMGANSKLLAWLKNVPNRLHEACYTLPSRVSGYTIAAVERPPFVRLIVVGAFLLAAVVASAFIMPIVMAWNVPYSYWQSLLLFNNWR